MKNLLIYEQDTKKRISKLENSFHKFIESFDEFKETITNYMRQLVVIPKFNTVIPTTIHDMEK